MRRPLAGGAVTLVLVTVVILLLVADDHEAAQLDRPPSPNVVLILTDDQHEGSLRFMPKTVRRLADKGTRFRNSFVTTPLCCPARATLLTGQYAHNHGVLANAGPRGGYAALDERETLPVWLDRRGYRTAFVGKYLNGYGRSAPRAVPQGWDAWHALLSRRMFGHSMNSNGRIARYGHERSDYATDVLADKAVGFLRSRRTERAPFFLMVAPSAPHSEPPAAVHGDRNPRPAPRHRGDLGEVRLARGPSFNEADVSDKPPQVRALKPLSRAGVASIERRYRARLESLLAVDDLVGRVVAGLRASGALGETLILFTSDNGFFHGEHRIRSDKRHVYEESIRVPLLVRGPGVSVGESRPQLASNLDLAPTILAVAGTEPGAGHALDGRSLVPALRHRGANLRDALLLEYFKDPGYAPRPYVALRTERFVYVRHRRGARELYDLRRDPYQRASRHADPAYRRVERGLAERLGKLRGCAGASCRRAATATQH